MNILCSICSEFINEDNLIVIVCGHCFHKKCITNWLNNSRTCPTCRSAVPSQTSLIKVFVETDQSRFNDLHDELLKNNEKMAKELKEMKEKARKQESELIELKAKQRENIEKIKILERDKQIDGMHLVSIRSIKEDLDNEIIKLQSQMSRLKLDMLAEKELRRIHQRTLHELDPKNENYDITSISLDDQPHQFPNFSVTPFWQIKPEDTKKVTKLDHPFIIPSKIQKANENKSSINQSKFSFVQKRPSDRKVQNVPCSSTQIKPVCDENSKNDSSTKNNRSETFKFGNSANPSSPFRFGNRSTDASNPESSSMSQQLTRSSSFKNYRDNPIDFGSPRPSER